MRTPTVRFALATLFAFSLGHAAAADDAPSKDKKDTGWAFTFSLLPKSFQKKPEIDMTVFTEVTDDGQTVAPASPDHPVYYVVVPGGFHQLGGEIANEHSPAVADLARVMNKALASDGYLPATDSSHRPSLLVVFNWGSHNRLPPEFARMSPQGQRRNMLERAILVGGPRFASEVGHAYEQRDLGQIGGSTFADVSFNLLDPVRRLTEGDDKMEYLMNQIHDDLYFVVASAYDYAALQQGIHRLLWRTKMTANARGVSMKETLPPLIATAAPFFAREMPGPEALQRHIIRGGQVEIGQPTVVEYLDSTPPAAAPAPTAPQANATKP